MDDLNNIWTNEDELNQDDLLKYLKGKSLSGETHAIEEQMAADPFVNDAVEGLQEMKDKEKLNDYISDLNKNLQKQIAKNKKVKEKRKIKDINWIVLAVILILAFSIMAFVVYFLLL